MSDMYESDMEFMKKFMLYMGDERMNLGFAYEEMLWVLKEIRENPKIKLADALNNAQAEWSDK